MKKIVMAALLLTGSNAYADVYLDVAIGYNVMSKYETMLGPKDTARFTLTWQPKEEGWFASYTHVSHLSAGFPFNNKEEDELNLFEVGYKKNLTRLFGRKY